MREVVVPCIAALGGLLVAACSLTIDDDYVFEVAAGPPDASLPQAGAGQGAEKRAGPRGLGLELWAMAMGAL